MRRNSKMVVFRKIRKSSTDIWSAGEMSKYKVPEYTKQPQQSEFLVENRKLLQDMVCCENGDRVQIIDDKTAA
ncbi:hypothetical protein AVEN_251813-1, partial [Araneus ventricosus]